MGFLNLSCTVCLYADSAMRHVLHTAAVVVVLRLLGQTPHPPPPSTIGSVRGASFLQFHQFKWKEKEQMWEAPPLSKLQEALASPSNPIGMRMRTAYFLRQAYENAIRNKDEDEEDGGGNVNKKKDVDDIVIETLGQELQNKKHGSLLRHEFAYCMGQLKDERCCPYLESVLVDGSDCSMVRHECAEALGGIGASRSIPILQQTMLAAADVPELAETCDISIQFMNWIHQGGHASDSNPIKEQPIQCACMDSSKWYTHDPAPPHPSHAHLTTQQLVQDVLCNPSLPLFERYRAMFSLRNRGGKEAVIGLGQALLHENSTSALFRHEIAFVLGQLAHPASLEYLEACLRKGAGTEHAMVRHEAAESLGSIEDRWEEVEKILKEFSQDDDVVVAESCVVALDAADYWGYGNNSQNKDDEKEEKVPEEKEA